MLEREDVSEWTMFSAGWELLICLLAIIKLIEDSMNVESDVKTVGVQTNMLVEDSVPLYSVGRCLLLYKYVLNESKEFSKEALNDHLRMMRMRGRPKILLARNYEEAVRPLQKVRR